MIKLPSDEEISNPIGVYIKTYENDFEKTLFSTPSIWNGKRDF